MTYGHPPPPRASNSPTLILLASGLTGILGFLIGFFAGIGSSEPAAAPYSAPEMTVTMESPTETPTPTGPSTGASAGVTDGGFRATPPADGGSTTQVSRPPAASQPPAATPTAGQQPTSGGSPQGSGLQVVGTDIQPGTYKTEGPAPGQPMCYWARLKGTGGDPGDVITSGLPTGPATVTIEATDKAFQSGGCGPWVRL
ncbi:hypothetical protein AB0B45_00190 [Nonomuraea sp. NPDC049152]|uniref:hypothetical protein n=1 Tax=Nonomuraea sp. NPDC049152 TaxID=3154350 RepID=UPI0033CD31D6